MITHARCSASTRCTAPTETTAGNAAPSRRWKRASYSPAPDAVACSNAAASSAWRSSGHHGNGVRAPSSSSRANPVISQMRSFTCTITRPPSGSSSVTRTPSAIVSSTRAVKSRSARTRRSASNRSVTSASVRTTPSSSPSGERRGRVFSSIQRSSPSGRWTPMIMPVRGSPSRSVRYPGLSSRSIGLPETSTNDQRASASGASISSSVRPRMRCTLAFADRMRPSSPSTIRPSLSDSTTAW